jgi:hypothetical protein
LPFHLLLYLTSGLFPTDFTIKILYAFLIYPRRITWATLLLSPNKYKLPISSTLPPLPPSANSGPNSQTPSIPLPKVKTKFHTHTKQIKLFNIDVFRLACITVIRICRSAAVSGPRITNSDLEWSSSS